jgi:hypothetical protein
MSKKLPERIDTEEEYNAVLDRLVTGARMIEDPLTTPEERGLYMKVYDALCHLIDDYQARERSKRHV